MRRVNTIKHLGVVRFKTHSWATDASEWSIVCSTSIMWCFSLQILSECHHREKITLLWVLYFWLECSFAWKETTLFGLNIQAPLPAESALSPSLSRAPASCFHQAGCLPWMSNRPGTWCIQAGLCSGIVTPSYVCTPDVLLTSIDFLPGGLFFFFFFLSEKRQPCRGERHCRGWISNEPLLSLFVTL